MFNLEAAISNWRRDMSRAGIRTDQLTELEAHLREHVQEKLKSGLTLEQAFASATSTLGEPRLLAREFTAATEKRRPLQTTMFAILALAVAFILFLAGAATFLCYDRALDRIMIATAILATLGAAFSWRLLLRLAPAIPHLGCRILAICVVAGSAFGIATFYCQIVVHFFASVDGLLPAVGYFCGVPAALGFGSIIAFEEAARWRMSNSPA